MGPDSELAGEGQRGSLQLLPGPGHTDPRVTGVPLCGALGFETVEATGLLSDVSLTVPLLSLQTCLTSSLCETCAGVSAPVCHLLGVCLSQLSLPNSLCLFSRVSFFFSLFPICIFLFIPLSLLFCY